MTTLAVIVSTSVNDNKTLTSLNFIEAAIKQGVKVTGVFFYQDGVTNANALISYPSDETNLMQQWQKLAEQYQVPLYLCVSAAEKRGILDEVSAKQVDVESNLASPFIVAGLGELVTLTSQADKTIQL